MADNSEFINWLKLELDRRGLSQAELARKAGVTRTAISNVISGNRRAGTDLCIAFATVFGVSIETVYRKAGFLPNVTEGQTRFEDWKALLALLSDEEVEELRRFAELKINMRRSKLNKQN